MSLDSRTARAACPYASRSRRDVRCECEPTAGGVFVSCTGNRMPAHVVGGFSRGVENCKQFERRRGLRPSQRLSSESYRLPMYRAETLFVWSSLKSSKFWNGNMHAVVVAFSDGYGDLQRQRFQGMFVLTIREDDQRQREITIIGSLAYFPVSSRGSRGVVGTPNVLLLAAHKKRCLC